jgi:hypothetical protein
MLHRKQVDEGTYIGHAGAEIKGKLEVKNENERSRKYQTGETEEAV